MRSLRKIRVNLYRRTPRRLWGRSFVLFVQWKANLLQPQRHPASVTPPLTRRGWPSLRPSSGDKHNAFVYVVRPWSSSRFVWVVVFVVCCVVHTVEGAHGRSQQGMQVSLAQYLTRRGWSSVSPPKLAEHLSVLASRLV